jgi:hypothetical protein
VVISGRRPFAQDAELLNYEYDSEAEWEAEEEDGEDIENSVVGSDEEGGEGDDLQYDEFFLKDNDFGSDADSDGEDMAATLIRSHRNQGYVVESIGPRFLASIETKPFIPFGSSDREESVLRSYTAMIMSPKSAFPILGQVAIAASPAENPAEQALEGSAAATENNATTSSAAVDTAVKDAAATDQDISATKSKVSKPRLEKEFVWSEEMVSELPVHASRNILMIICLHADLRFGQGYSRKER